MISFGIMTRYLFLSAVVVLIVILQDANACIRSHQPSCDCQAMEKQNDDNKKIIHDLRERRIQDTCIHEKLNLKNKLDRSNGILEQKESDIKNKVREHKETIGKKDAEISEHKQTIGKKDAEISEHKQTIGKKDAEISEHKQTISEKDAEISEHKMTIDKKDAEINECNMTLGKLDAQLAAERRLVILLKQRLGDMNISIIDLMQSLKKMNEEHDVSVKFVRRELAGEKEQRAQAEEHLKWSWGVMSLIAFMVAFVSILGYKYRKFIWERASRAGTCVWVSLCPQMKLEGDSKNRDYPNVHPTELCQKDEKSTLEATL